MASSLETNKVLAALLTAGVIASGVGVMSRMIYHPHVPEETAYHIDVAASEEAGAEAAGAQEQAAGLAELLAVASVDSGAAVAKKCAACHSFEPGGANKIGPALWGVVGRDIAAASGFAYSEALLGKDGSWDFDSLNGFFADPKGWAPGTKMAFAGLKKPEERADLLVYLRSLSDDPVPLPEATAAAAEQPASTEATAATAEQPAPTEPTAATAEQPAPTETTAVTAEQPAPAETTEAAAEQEVAAVETEGAGATAGGDGIGGLLAQADLGAGEKDAKKCAVCHNFDKGGSAKIGPPLWGVVGRPVGSIDGFAYSDALAGHGGDWDYAALDAFLTKPKDWAPGTKMAFVGVKKPEDRADIILYLRSLADEPAPLP